jgi:hypothetical protein
MEEHIGQFATVYRRLLLWYVALEQWPTNSMYLPSVPPASRDETAVFTMKRESLAAPPHLALYAETQL